MSEKILLKDLLFNEAKLSLIARQIKKTHSNFADKEFVFATTKEIKNLELKERIAAIAKNLKNFLPKDYKKSVQILLKSLPKPLNENLCDDVLVILFIVLIQNLLCKMV